MNLHSTFRPLPRSTPLWAVLAAVVCTALQFAGLVAIAEDQGLPSRVRVVQLDRVVVSGKRLAPEPAVAATAADPSATAMACVDTAARRC